MHEDHSNETSSHALEQLEKEHKVIPNHPRDSKDEATIDHRHFIIATMTLKRAANVKLTYSGMEFCRKLAYVTCDLIY